MFRQMTVVGVLLAGCGQAPVTAESATPSVEKAAAGTRSDVTIHAFVEAHASGATVLDVRSQAEFDKGRVPGAKLLPVGELKPDHPVLADVPKDEKVYVICHSGGRSSRAADQLAKAGWNAVNVQGGTQAWISAGKEVEK